MHINRYKAAEEVPPGLQLVIDNTVYLGSYVAVLDNSDDRHYHLAEVLDINDHKSVELTTSQMDKTVPSSRLQ